MRNWFSCAICWSWCSLYDLRYISGPRSGGHSCFLLKESLLYLCIVYKHLVRFHFCLGEFYTMDLLFPFPFEFEAERLRTQRPKWPVFANWTSSQPRWQVLHAASTGAEMSMLHCHYLDKMVLIGPLLVAMLFPVQTLNQNWKMNLENLFKKAKLKRTLDKNGIWHRLECTQVL